jgi:dTDP-4-dehydrorhamnose 3,5-epimerase
MYVGTLRPWQLLIPPGLAHGYEVIGAQSSSLVYATDRFYNPDDEGRIPYNDLQIQYGWKTQHK